MKIGSASLILALFLGVYALVLELKGIANSDQILLALLFGLIASFRM